jgi:D-3-phosphoglycerate dehydrogenase / 2-oxoglutarate reductase
VNIDRESERERAEIYISTTPFGEADPSSLQVLESSGFNLKRNRTGRKHTSVEVCAAAIDSTVLIAGTEDLSLLITESQSLKMISRVGIGLDGVPLKLCRDKGIIVSWTPDAVTSSVAEFTIGLMIAASRSIGRSDRELRSGVWRRPPSKRIQESAIGLVGFGRIGMRLAGLLRGFQPNQVLVNDIKDKTSEIESFHASGLNISSASLDELIACADIVSLHLPLWRLTADLIDAKRLKKMRPGATIINTSRGGIINEDDLYSQLDSGHIGGAALDVFGEEPYCGPLRELDNVILTPHLGSCSFDARARMEREAGQEALRFLGGAPLEQVVPETEYLYSSK